MTVDTAFSSPNTAGNDDVTLAGTTVAVNAPVTGGTVGLTSTSGGISGTSGVTANTLNLNSAGTINLAANVVGTLNATANGAITFTNAGGLAAGNIASNGNNISLHDTTGAGVDCRDGDGGSGERDDRGVNEHHGGRRVGDGRGRDADGGHRGHRDERHACADEFGRRGGGPSADGREYFRDRSCMRSTRRT